MQNYAQNLPDGAFGAVTFSFTTAGWGAAAAATREGGAAALASFAAAAILGFGATGEAVLDIATTGGAATTGFVAAAAVGLAAAGWFCLPTEKDVIQG